MTKTDKIPHKRLSRTPLATQVHEVLCEMLLSGALAPDDSMSMRELAERLGVSVMPVREAVTRLGASGALYVSPNRAVRVPVLSRDQFLDLTHVRIMNESEAARMAAARVTPADEPQLLLLENTFRDSMSSPDHRDSVRANKALHFAVYGLCGSPILQEVISVLWLKVGPVLNFDLGQQSRRTRNATSISTHRRLIAALLSGDGDGAAQALTDDIQSAADFILSRGILGDTA